MTDRRRTILIQNGLISLGLLGLVIFFELRQNREATMMALGALLLLWKHSGRPHAPAAPASCLLPVAALLGCAFGCEAPRSAELQLLTLRMGPGPVMGPAMAPAGGVAADYIAIGTQASNPVPAGKAGLWASSADGQLRIVDTAGVQLKAGAALTLRTNSNCAGLSASAGDVCYDTTLGQPRFYAGSGWSSLPLDTLLVHLAGSETITGAKTFTSNVAMSGQKITGLGQGTASGQALHAGRSVSTTSGQLTGGGALTSDLTLGLATAGTAGTYAWPSSVTTDAYGRAAGVTAGTCPQNQVLAGPVAGGSGAVACRALDTADLPGGGGGGGPFWIYDPALIGQAVAGPSSSGDFTIGWLFAVYSARQITGGKVWWPGGAATLVLKLYDNGGSELKTKTETVSGSGLVNFTFASAFTPTPGTNYRIGVYDGGTTFPGAIGSATDPNAPNAAVRNGEWMLITPTYAVGGAAPLVDATWTYPYPLRPKFSGEQ